MAGKEGGGGGRGPAQGDSSLERATTMLTISMKGCRPGDVSTLLRSSSATKDAHKFTLPTLVARLQEERGKSPTGEPHAEHGRGSERYAPGSASAYLEEG